MINSFFKACIIIFVIAVPPGLYAQESDFTSRKWEFDGSLNMYFVPNDFIFMPVVSADKGRLHLEARYNYEDMKTASIWAGYNFSLGNKLKLEATAMGGVVLGETDGLAPGLEFTLSYKNFFLYQESEYVFSLDDKFNSYYYLWSELGYAPTEWLNFGLTAQRLKNYKTDFEVQKGIFAGGIYKAFYLTGYFYNMFDEERYFILTLGVNF